MESLIPLLIIAILAIFIAGKVGLFNLQGIPLIGGLFPAPMIKVLVVTGGYPIPHMKALLTSDEFRLAGVVYAELKQDAIMGRVLDPFDIVILYNAPYCERTARKAITDKVKAGGKLIVIGDSCTRVADDPWALGFDIGVGLLGDIMPVRYSAVLAHEYMPGARGVLTTGRFRIIAPEHPIFSGIITHHFSGAVFEATPTAIGNPLAIIEEIAGRRTTAYAIVESTAPLGLPTFGKVLYFAYDPASPHASKMLFLNTLLYLKGVRG